MDNKRTNNILYCILCELYDKSFDCNSKEFEDWLISEIGITKEEINYLKENDYFPKYDL